MAKVIVTLVIVILVLIFVIISFWSKRYNEGFAIGVLVGFIWIHNNTGFTDAFKLYKEITDTYPEDGIYICKKTSKGRFVLKKRSKMISFSEQK